MENGKRKKKKLVKSLEKEKKANLVNLKFPTEK